MPSLRNPGQHSAGCDTPAARYADLETRGGAEMPIMQKGTIRAACSHDQAYSRTRNHAVSLGASRRREVRPPIEAALSPLSGVLFHDRDVSVGLVSYHFPASHEAGQDRGFG